MKQSRDFEDFYAANYGKITALVAAVIGDWHEADDIAQEAFARALARHHHRPAILLVPARHRRDLQHGQPSRRALLLARPPGRGNRRGSGPGRTR